MPVWAASDDKEFGIRVIAELAQEVREELCQINYATQQGTLLNVVGLFTPRHLIEVLHNTGTGHMGSRKLLAKFRERYTYYHNRQIAEVVTRACNGCQQGNDYRPRRPPRQHQHHGPLRRDWWKAVYRVNDRHLVLLSS